MSGRLAAFIRDEAGADTVTVANEKRLAGGAIQENRALDVEIAGGPHAGSHALVLRTEAKSSVPLSQPVANQFACLERARSVGMTVPEPLWRSDDPEIVGAPFYLMRRVEGEALGNRVVRQGPNPSLAECLGRELARLHKVVPPDDALGFLGEPPADPAASGIALYRGFLDAEAMPHPVIEWGLRWLDTHPVAPGGIVLCHHDFRTGNYMVQDGRLTGILDWEFAGWADPMEDVAWFCARCWRFGAHALEAGGIADRAPFYAGYEAESGRRIDPEKIRFYEVMAHVRWAVIALHQCGRHLSGAEPDLELALIGRRLPELEHEILRLTAPGGRDA